MSDEQKVNEIANTTSNYTNLEKMTPKFCNSVQVALLSSGNIVLSMIFNEPQHPGTLIERVVIDSEHANNLADILKSAVIQAKENKEGKVH